MTHPAGLSSAMLGTMSDRRRWRLSELQPIDLSSMRETSLQRARQDIDAGQRRAVHVDVYPDRHRALLGDGRHRAILAMRLGLAEWPAIVTVYGPRAGVRERYKTMLELDAMP